MSLCMANLQEHQLSLSWPQGMTSYKIPIHLIPSQQLPSGPLRAEKPWSQGWPSPPQLNSTYCCWRPLRSSCFRNPVDKFRQKKQNLKPKPTHTAIWQCCWFICFATCLLFPSSMKVHCVRVILVWLACEPRHMEPCWFKWPQAPIELQVWISAKVTKHHPQNTRILAQYTTDLIMNPSWPPPPCSSSTLVFNTQLHNSENVCGSLEKGQIYEGTLSPQRVAIRASYKVAQSWGDVCRWIQCPLVPSLDSHRWPREDISLPPPKLLNIPSQPSQQTI